MEGHAKEHSARPARRAPRPTPSRDGTLRASHDPASRSRQARPPRGGDGGRLPARSAQEALLDAIEAEAGRGELTDGQMAELARLHGVSLSAVLSLYTFYFPRGSWTRIKVCSGLPCALRGAETVRSRSGASGSETGNVSCLGYCAEAPVVWSEGRYYTHASGQPEEIAESTAAWVDAHVQGLRAYRSEGGYTALKRVLDEPDRASLLGVVEAAVLRGMGGAGFPVYLKWKAVIDSPRQDRVVVVNAHEGEPGTFKDRLILEREPHRLLEGALIAAAVVGAAGVVIALKKEYANAHSVLERSLRELEESSGEMGLDGRLPDLELRSLVGSYITGEETALLEALEGKRSEPRSRPPFPAEVGLYGRPTLVQNVETLASIPRLLAESSRNAAPGKVEKLFCLTGDVRKPGAYREPLGIRAVSLVEKDGRSPAQGLKAFLPGGLSGGLLPASKLDVELDFDAVRKNGCGLGTGAVVAIGTDRCIVDLLGTLGEFFRSESCGKCVPCRLGTAKLSALMGLLRDGRATEQDLRDGEAVARLMQETSLCALGQVAGKPLLDAMSCLREEIVAHTRGDCPTRVCPAAGD